MAANPTANPNRPRRRVRLGAALLAALGIGVALVTLLGLEAAPLIPAEASNGLASLSQILVQIVTIVGALAVVLGILNLLNVHVRQVRQFPRGIYSAVMLITLVVVVVLRILERTASLQVGDSDVPIVTLTLMDALQVVVESALAGLLFFFLVFAAYRLMRRRATIWNYLFVAALVLVLFGYSPLSGLEFLTPIRDWLLAVPVNAGTRGLLIGVAIGTVTVGIRLLIGRDRTFRE